MKVLTRVAVVLVALGSLSVTQADLISLGDVTLDNTSGLEWLDLTETQGISFDQILAGTGGYLEDGWLPATGDQIDDLFLRYSFFVPE